jgi:aldehyde:ferredoxin oxidoreductase
MLKEYYRGRGWDENGVPTAKKLAELELANLQGVSLRTKEG